MKLLPRLCSSVHALLALLFSASCLLLIVIAVRAVWRALAGGLDEESAVTSPRP